MKVLEKIYEIFTAIVKYFLFAIFFFATIFVVINVFGRKLFGFSFNWLEELNRYILIICTFLVCALISAATASRLSFMAPSISLLASLTVFMNSLKAD